MFEAQREGSGEQRVGVLGWSVDTGVPFERSTCRVDPRAPARCGGAAVRHRAGGGAAPAHPSSGLRGLRAAQVQGAPLRARHGARPAAHVRGGGILRILRSAFCVLAFLEV